MWTASGKTLPPRVLAGAPHRSVAIATRLQASLLGLALVCSGCSDVGDSSAVPAGPDGAGDAASDSTASLVVDAAVEAETSGPTTPGGDGGVTTPVPDTVIARDASGADGRAEDAGRDSTLADGMYDSGPDATVGDGEANAEDAGVSEAGFDSTVPDAEGLSGVDAGAAEASVDGGGQHVSEAGGGLVPCSVAGQTDCVECDGNASGTGNNGGLCTPTEALFVQLDIDNGTVTAPGIDPFDPNNPSDPTASGCYPCLYNFGCIDDTAFSDKNHECGDLPGGNFTAGDGMVGPFSADCVATLQCLVATNCANSTSSVDNCYCGPGGGSPSLCPNNGPTTNGVCKTAETNGFLFMPNDSTDILKNYSDKAEPSGLANQIFVCARANSCMQCFP